MKPESLSLTGVQTAHGHASVKVAYKNNKLTHSVLFSGVFPPPASHKHSALNHNAIFIIIIYRNCVCGGVRVCVRACVCLCVVCMHAY